MALDKQELLAAISNTDAETLYFVDMRTQSIRKLSAKEPQGIAKMKEEVAVDPKRFLRIPIRSAREKMAELHEFCQTVTDLKLRAQLEQASNSPYPYREIQHLLERRFKEQRQWESYRKNSNAKRMQTFLKLTGLKLG